MKSRKSRGPNNDHLGTTCVTSVFDDLSVFIVTHWVLLLMQEENQSLENFLHYNTLVWKVVYYGLLNQMLFENPENVQKLIHPYHRHLEFLG